MGQIGQPLAPGILIPEDDPIFVPTELPTAPAEPIKTPEKEPVPA